MVCVISRGTVPFHPGHRVHARRVVLAFETGSIPVGERRGQTGSFAYVDANDPDVADGLNTLRALPQKWEIVECPDSAVPMRRVERVQTEVRNDDKAPHPVRRAFTNGWTLVDLWGTGAGEKWDEQGGRSPRTGLTVLEMAMTVPPPSWSCQWVEEHYPWEDLAFRKPHPDWAPANVPPKGNKPTVAPVMVAGEPQGLKEAALVLPPDPQAPVTLDPEPLAESSVPGNEGYSSLPDAIRSWRSQNDPEPLDTYGSPAQAQAAAELLAGMSAMGERPSVQKFNYAANKKKSNPGLPNATEATFRAFNAILDTLG